MLSGGRLWSSFCFLWPLSKNFFILLDTTSELLYFSSAFGLGFCLLGQRFKVSLQDFKPVTYWQTASNCLQSRQRVLKQLNQISLDFEGGLGTLASVYGPFWALIELRSQAFPKMVFRRLWFSHNGTLRSLFSRLYQQFLLTLKSELLYVLGAFQSLGFVPAMSK